MCGGPSREQRQAAQQQSQLANTLSSLAAQREALQQPYIQSRIEGGLPFREQALDFSGGSLARSYAPARGALLRRLSGYGSALPSGFREQALTDFDTQRARAFDDNVLRTLLLDEATRARAAGLTDPLGYFTGAERGLGSIISMPGRANPLGSIFGGAVSSLVRLIPNPNRR